MNQKETKRFLKNIRKRMDKACSLAVRTRDNFTCQVCKRTNKEVKIHAHHIIPREYYAGRWDMLNMISLCALHHKYGQDSAHQNALWFIEWLKNYDIERYSYLQAKMIKIHNSIMQ